MLPGYLADMALIDSEIALTARHLDFKTAYHHKALSGRLRDFRLK
jgi:hypothetical protein